MYTGTLLVYVLNDYDMTWCVCVCRVFLCMGNYTMRLFAKIAILCQAFVEGRTIRICRMQCEPNFNLIDMNDKIHRENEREMENCWQQVFSIVMGVATNIHTVRDRSSKIQYFSEN